MLSIIEVKAVNSLLNTKMEDGNATARRVRGFAMPSAIFRLLILVVLIIAVGNLTFVSPGSPDKLRFLILVIRSGEHRPIYTFPADTSIKWGVDDLTHNGKTELCNLGKKIFHRYHALLPNADSYSSNNIRIKSSAENGCIKSADQVVRCMPAELVRGTDNKNTFTREQIASKSVTDFPTQTFKTYEIVTEIIPKDKDNMLGQTMQCPKFKNLLHEIRTNPQSEMHKFNTKHATLYATLTTNAKEPLPIADAARAAEIYDTIVIKQKNKLSVPSWATPSFMEELRPIKAHANLPFGENDYMNGLQTGHLLADIATALEHKSNGHITHNIVIYSGTESALVHLMNALGVIPVTGALPDYGAALGIELYESGNEKSGSWEIELAYYQDAKTDSNNPKTINSVTNCNWPCTPNKFREKVNTILKNAGGPDYAKACQVNNPM